MKAKNARNLAGGLIVGAALGAAAGLLLAPASGEKTRRRLIKGSMRAKENVVDYIEDSLDSLRSQFNQKIDYLSSRAKDAANRGAEKAEAAIAKTRNQNT